MRTHESGRDPLGIIRRHWIPAALAAWALAGLAACSGGKVEGADPCDQVDCSGHGSCAVQGEDAVCECEAGFHADGLSCVADADPCDQVDCSGHGSCSVQGDQAVCTCEAGYHAQGLACVADADPCDQVTCSGHGTCSVQGDQAVCNCEAGYHADGLACVADSGPCDQVDCSGHGTCSVQGDQAVCNCDAGYHADGLSCVADADPCDQVTCSGHGTCSVQAGDAVCECEAGYHAAGLACVADVAQTGWLYTKDGDNKIYVDDGSGERVWVGRGVNMDDLFLCGYNYTLWMDDPTAEHELLNIVDHLVAEWRPTFVRVSLSMSSFSDRVVSWLDNPAEYHDPMVNVIHALGANPGVYVLIALRSDASMSVCDNGDDAVCVPTAQTDPVYEALVDDFQDAPYVLFGLSNEPGGMSQTDDDLRAAMDHAVSVIRAREDQLGSPHHLVAVQGNQWTSRIGFYSDNPLPYDNVVYEYHSYPPQPTGQYGYTYANIPVIIGEYGSLNDSATFYSDVEAKQIPNLAWDFEPFSNCAPDLLVVNYSSTNLVPTAWGSTVQAYLLAH